MSASVQTSDDRAALAEHVRTAASALAVMRQQLGSVVLGQPAAINLVVASLASSQHVLLWDRPGVGKTTLATAFARLIDGQLRRIQGASDLLPTDVTGASIHVGGQWVFQPGPIFGHVVLIDEINRIAPRSQSALLEALSEGSVTVEGVTRRLPRPFIAIATMNPPGSAGTSVLPDSQVDRFGCVVRLGRVDREAERTLLTRSAGPVLASEVAPVLTPAQWEWVTAVVAAVGVAPSVADYTLDLCDEVRRRGYISTRGARAVIALARGFAALEARSFVTPDDVRRAIVPALGHRLAGEDGDLRAADAAIAAAVTVVAPPTGR